MMPEMSDEAAKSAEPFKRLITQGMVHGKTYTDPDTGRFLKPEEVDLSDAAMPRMRATGEPVKVVYEKMSKSKHNGVDPTDFIEKYGADATRAHMVFQAPVPDVLNWDEKKIAGVTRWLTRLHEQVGQVVDAKQPPNVSIKKHIVARAKKVDSMKGKHLAEWDAEAGLWREVQQTIKSVTASYEDVYSLNTVVSDLMSLTNAVVKSDKASIAVRREALSSIVRMVAPIAPAFAEECWSLLVPDSTGSMFRTATFPVEDGTIEMLQPRKQNCAVQVNGKVRAVVQIPVAPADLAGEALQSWMTAEILASEEGKEKFVGGGVYDLSRAKRVIPVKGGRNVNYVM
jgi:leucyl-tRNA synthetase